MSRLVLYCAFTCAARDDWQAMMPEPKKPGNVGEKKWLEEKLPAKWKQLEAEAPYHFLSGRVEGVTALDDNGPVFEGDAAGFVQYLQSLESDAKDTNGGQLEVFLCAFDATLRLRHLLWTCAALEQSASLWLWTGTSENRYSDYDVKFSSLGQPKLRLVDMESLTGAKGAKIPWGDWIRAWGVCPSTSGDTWMAVHTAEVVRGLAGRLGFGNVGN